MEEIKQYVIDYLEGRIEPQIFTQTLKTDASLLDWLQSIVPEGKVGYFEKIVRPDGSWYQRTGPYSVRHATDMIFESKRSRLVTNMEIFGVVSRLYAEAFPDETIRVSTALREKHAFLLEACPDYLDSVEIADAGILEGLMEEFPDTMPKTKRVKAFRNKLKAMFYVEGQKYPRWIQQSEWPLSKTGKPTKFLRQRSAGEVCFYDFLDVDSGEEIEVTQAY